MKNKLELVPYVSEEMQPFALLSSPKPAITTIPDWLRDQPGKYRDEEGNEVIPEENPHEFRSNNLTVKRCMPFFDALSQDFVVTTNLDLGVSRGPNQLQRFALIPDMNYPEHKIYPIDEEIEGHPRAQFGHMPVPYEYEQTWAYKWRNRYGYKVPKGYSVVFHHPHNRMDLPFYTLSGTVDVDNFQTAVNFPFLMKKDFIGIIPKGTPVVQFSIIKRQQWETSLQKYTDKNIEDAILDFQNSGDNHYKKNFRASRRFV